MRIADHGRLGDLGVRYERAFDLGRSHAVTGHVENVVGTPRDPVVAVLVASCAVACRVVASVRREVRFDEALVIAIHRAHLAGPAVGDDEIARNGPFERLAVGIEQRRLDAEEWPRGRARFQIGDARQWRNQDAARLGLPPGVDDRAATVADHVVIPLPGFGVDRLTNRTQQAQRFARRLLDRVVAFAHERANRRRRRVADVDLVLVADFPEPRRRRIVGHAFEHDRDRAVGERPVDNVTVSRDPADVGGAPVDVARVIVEDVLVRQRGVHHVTACRMQHALRFTRRSRGVKDEQRVFGVHLLAGAIGIYPGLDFVQPLVTPVDPVDIGAGMLDHEHLLERLDRRIGGRSVDVLLERHDLAAADALVRRNDDVGLAVHDASRQRVGREAAEHDRVHGADARARKHGNRRFGNHRHVDRDAVALLRAERLQCVGELADALVQLTIGDLRVVLGIIAFPDDGDVVAFRFKVAIDAVVTGIQRAVVVPANVQVVLRKGHVLHFRERLDPVDALGLLAPERFVVFHRTGIHLLIARLVDECTFFDVLGNRVDVIHDVCPCC